MVAVALLRSHDSAPTRVVITPEKRVGDAVALVEQAGNFAMRFSGTMADGSGVTSLQPLGVFATSKYGTARFDGHRIWTNTDTGPGVPLGDYAQAVYGTLGTRNGALAMLALASPTGYLQIAAPEIEHASAVGTDTVDGVTVQLYDVTIDLSKMLTLPSVTDDERPILTHALDVLRDEHLTVVDERVSVDSDGFIRRTTRVAHFADGGTVTGDVVLSQFGCAGPVLMPGTTAPATSTTTTSTATTSTSTTSTTPAALAPTTSTVATTPSTEAATTTSTTSTTVSPCVGAHG